MALSVVAANRLDIYRRRGEPLPEGWALDKDGEPTNDADRAEPRRLDHGGGRATRAPAWPWSCR